MDRKKTTQIISCEKKSSAKSDYRLLFCYFIILRIANTIHEKKNEQSSTRALRLDEKMFCKMIQIMYCLLLSNLE